MHAKTGRPIVVTDRAGRVQRSEVFWHNPKILKQPQAGCARLVNASGVRPYIEAKSKTRWLWKRFRIVPGELYFSSEELAFAQPYRGCVMVEPTAKVAQGNKGWLWERWQSVVDGCAAPMIQCAPPGGAYLRDVTAVVTPSFRLACAVLSVSTAFVGCDGGLVHAAAALNVPTVALWSEFIGPEYVGYPQHRNIRHAGIACGSRLPCSGCRASMARITVAEVLESLASL